MLRKAIKAELADDWSERTKSEELNPWMAKVKESCQARRKEEHHSRPSRAGVTLSHVCPATLLRTPEEHICAVVSTHTRMTELCDVKDHRLQVKMQAPETNPPDTLGSACTCGGGDMRLCALSATVWAPMTFSRRSTPQSGFSISNTWSLTEKIIMRRAPRGPWSWNAPRKDCEMDK